MLGKERDAHATWTEQAVNAGLDIDTLIPSGLRGDHHPAAPADEVVVAEALRRVSEESSTWLRADLARHVATLLPAGSAPTARDLVTRVDQLAWQAKVRCVELSPHDPQQSRCRRDGRPVVEHVTDRRLTTTTVLQQEQGLQRWARSAVRHHPPTTTDLAEEAVEAMAGSAKLVVVVGPAGTGRTTATAESVAALQAAGRPVIGLAPSGKAADVLAAEAGCPTATLAGFLTRTTGTGASPPPGGDHDRPRRSRHGLHQRPHPPGQPRPATPMAAGRRR